MFNFLKRVDPNKKLTEFLSSDYKLSVVTMFLIQGSNDKDETLVIWGNPEFSTIHFTLYDYKYDVIAKTKPENHTNKISHENQSKLVEMCKTMWNN